MTKSCLCPPPFQNIFVVFIKGYDVSIDVIETCESLIYDDLSDVCLQQSGGFAYGDPWATKRLGKRVDTVPDLCKRPGQWRVSPLGLSTVSSFGLEESARYITEIEFVFTGWEVRAI